MKVVMKKSIFTLLVSVTVLCALLLIRSHEGEEVRAHAVIVTDAGREKERNRVFQTPLHPTETETLPSGIIEPKLGRQPADANNANPQPKNPAEIFRDPEMREAMMAQSKAAVAASIRSLLDSGLAELLTNEQTVALDQLLTEKGSLVWEQILIPMMTGEMNEAEMNAAGRAVRQTFAENTAQIRALLGEVGFEVFDWFEKTQPDRDTLSRFSPQFAQAGHELTAEQKSSLLALMNDERVNFQFQFDVGDPSKWNFEDPYANVTEERIQTYSHELEELNALVLKAAESVLTPEQNVILMDLLAQQLQQAKFTARTTSAMFGRKH